MVCLCGWVGVLRLVYLFYERLVVCFFKQKTAYEMRISDWSSDVCSSDLLAARPAGEEAVVSGAHPSPSEMREPRTPVARTSGSVRSRLRLVKGRSTWWASTKAARRAWIACGIGTASMISVPG